MSLDGPSSLSVHTARRVGRNGRAPSATFAGRRRRRRRVRGAPAGFGTRESCDDGPQAPRPASLVVRSPAVSVVESAMPAGDVPRWRVGRYNTGASMQIRVGFEMVYRCPQPTPMILTLSVHYSRVSDLLRPDHLVTSPSVPVSAYRDLFGNWCSRLVAPQGRFVLSTDALINDTGAPDVVASSVTQTSIEHLPESTLVYLLGSRYCETDQLSDIAWKLLRFGPDRLGARAGDLRFRASTHRVRLQARSQHDARPPLRPYNERQRRMSRLCASRRSVLPLHEYPGALLHRLSWRYRHARLRYAADGFRGVVRGLSRRRLVHVRSRATTRPASAVC